MQRRISASCKGNSYEVFNCIEKQIHVDFSYRISDDYGKNIFFTPDSCTLQEALTIIKSQLQVDFKVVGTETILLLPMSKEKREMIISGFVSDDESAIRLPGAIIKNPKTGKMTVTNDDGYFNFRLEADTATLLISYVGYQTTFLKIEKPKSHLFNIFLKPGTMLKEAMVFANRDSVYINQLTQYTDLRDELQRKLPFILGRGDLLNSVGLIPGVYSVRDVSPGLFVRGGGPDQNLILLDGVSVYNATHLFGLVSIFDSDVIQTAHLYKDAFPANFGGRLSSVLDLKTRSGNSKKFKLKTNAGLLAAGFAVEGPIIKDKFSFLVSARRSYTDLLIRNYNKLIQNDASATPAYYFYDINAKLHFRFNGHSYATLSLFSGADRGSVQNRVSLSDSTKLSEISRSTISWNTNNAVFKWCYTPKGSVFNTFSISYNRYQLKFNDAFSVSHVKPQEQSLSYNFSYLSGIEDFGLKNETDFNLGNHLKFKTGFNALVHNFQPGRNTYNYQNNKVINIDTSSGVPFIRSSELQLFIQSDYTFKKFNVNCGIQHAVYYVDNKFYQALQPRLSLNYKLSKYISLMADANRMVQFIHLLPNNNLGIPYDIWLPVAQGLKPLLSDQISVGLLARRGAWSYYSDIYFKQQSNLLEFKDGANIVYASENWASELTAGKGKVRGWEQLIKYNHEKWIFLGSYALSKADRTFSAINNGKVFPFKYDRRHQISAAIVWQKSDKWTFSATWFFLSGNPVTIAEDKYLLNLEGQPVNVELISTRNNFRMPDYHRLDLAAIRKVSTKKFDAFWNFGLYNAYNHQNPYFLFFGYSKEGKYVLKQRSLLPVLPTFSFNISWK